MTVVLRAAAPPPSPANGHLHTRYASGLSPWDRPQGYRLHLEADALNALREVLPADLHRLFEATAMRTRPLTTILGTDLSLVKQLLTDDGQDPRYWPDFQTGEDIHCNVDRATVRQILLTGLDDICHFGKRLTHYDSRADGVTATFADGTTAEGDILVGADGIHSAVRQQRAPQAQTMDAGVQAIYGRIPWESAAELVPSPVLEDIFAIASDTRKVFLGLGAVKFPARPDEAAARTAAQAELKQQDDYVVCVVGGRHEHFPANEQALRDVPCELDAPGNVTVLGDAIHAMTPTLGRGANLALRDGALLGRQLKAAAAGQKPVSQALAVYEAEMLRYSFDVVRESVQIGEQRMGQNPLPA